MIVMPSMSKSEAGGLTRCMEGDECAVAEERRQTTTKKKEERR